MIKMEMGLEFEAVKRELGDLGGRVDEAVGRGLAAGGQLAAATVVRDYLSGQALKRRTGMLAKHVTSWLSGRHRVTVGVPAKSPVKKYKWLLSDEQKTIRPKKGKFLAIPIGEGLTGAGAARYKSPREVKDGFFIKSKTGQLLFGFKRGQRGKFRPLFVLVKSVQIQGTGALYDGVMDTLDEMAGAIEDEVGRIKDVE